MSVDADLSALVRRAQRGDALAMNALLDLLTPFVSRICAPIALGDALDATQEALVAIFRGLRGLREPAALYGWVRLIAAREAVRMARREHDALAVELTEVPARDDPQLLADVTDVLRRLSPEHRAVLVLRDFEGMNERDAAALLEVPAGTVKSRLSRARESFREAWRS